RRPGAGRRGPHALPRRRAPGAVPRGRAARVRRGRRARGRPVVEAPPQAACRARHRGHRALDARTPPRRARRGLAHPHRRARLHRSVKQAGAPEVGAPAALIAPCAEPGVLAGLKPHPGLDAFAPATNGLVGYVAFHAPSEVETWGDDRTGALVELGAVEVADAYRGQRLAERLLAASFEGGRFDDTVVFATLYRWHYDLPRTGLGELGYRRMLERLYGTVGLVPVATTDPEIAHDPANRLVARVGPRAPEAVVREFDRLRTRRW